jgi:hypothetical protein
MKRMTSDLNGVLAVLQDSTEQSIKCVKVYGRMKSLLIFSERERAWKKRTPEMVQ